MPMRTMRAVVEIEKAELRWLMEAEEFRVVIRPQEFAATMNRHGTKSEAAGKWENRSSGLIQTPFGSSDSIEPRSKSVG